MGDGNDSGDVYSRLRTNDSGQSWDRGYSTGTHVPVLPDRVRELHMSCDVPKSESIALGLS